MLSVRAVVCNWSWASRLLIVITAVRWQFEPLNWLLILTVNQCKIKPRQSFAKKQRSAIVHMKITQIVSQLTAALVATTCRLFVITHDVPPFVWNLHNLLVTPGNFLMLPHLMPLNVHWAMAYARSSNNVVLSTNISW